MNYSEKILRHQASYPFDKWKTYFHGAEELETDEGGDDEEDEESGMKQYTPENCEAARKIMDDLLRGLIRVGETAPESAKVELFRVAVQSLNKLNNENLGLIETMEREELCDLFDRISLSAGLNPKDYAGGRGIADLWREW
jgi:hypothetical protein